MTQPLSLNTALTGESWGLARIIRRNAPWNVDHIQLPMETYFRCVRDGAGVDVYHFDSGIRTTHDEFGGRATVVYDAVGGGGGGDPDGHGTFTASQIVGATVGIARGAEIFSFRLQTNLSGSAGAMIEAAEEALNHYASRAGLNRPAVANFSAQVASNSVNTAIGALIDAGMVVVASAGNEGQELGVGLSWYPALTTDAICVGASGMADIPLYVLRDSGFNAGLMSITNFGAAIDIMAPGHHARAAGIASDSDYVHFFASTSGACAYVSGVVACMLQGHDRLTSRADVQAVRAALLANATTGKLREAFGLSPLPDKILYLDPDQTAPEPISGL